MKKCSTATLIRLAVSAACKVMLGMWLTQLPAIATEAARNCEWASEAPDHHRVQRGDTLWALASLFLKNPWCWPHVWEKNRDHVRDPHWIYPGQLILLDRAQGVLRLGEPDQGAYPAARLSPSVRALAPQRTRIPAISDHLLRMMSRTRLLEAHQLENAPAIVGITESRKLAAEGDAIIVRGQIGSQQHFDIIRPSAPVVDPDSRQTLGVVGKKLGRASLVSRGTLSHRFLVTASDAELQAGDRLVPVAASASAIVSVHASEAPAGKLAAILHEGRWAGPNDLVVINRGADHKLSPGSVVRVAQHVRIRADESKQTPLLSEEAPQVALLLVLGVADRMSVAVVVRSRDTVTVGDIVLPP